MAISADTPEDSAAFIEKKEITVPLLSDPTLKVIMAYGVAMEGEDIAVPATFIIGGDRTVHWQYVGENMTDRPDALELLEKATQIRRGPQTPSPR